MAMELEKTGQVDAFVEESNLTSKEQFYELVEVEVRAWWKDTLGLIWGMQNEMEGGKLTWDGFVEDGEKVSGADYAKMLRRFEDILRPLSVVSSELWGSSFDREGKRRKDAEKARDYYARWFELTADERAWLAEWANTIPPK